MSHTRMKLLMKILRGMTLAVGIGVMGIAVVACGTTSQPSPALNLNPYKIEFSTAPNALTAGTPAVLQAHVTGEEAIPKRAEVSFDVKQAGSDERDEVNAERKSEGRYEGGYTFKEPGRYSITVHVITRSVHQVANREVDVK